MAMGWGVGVTTNFGGVDVVPLQGANPCFTSSFYIQGHQFHPDTQENNNEFCLELLADVTLFSTLITQKLFFAILGLCWYNYSTFQGKNHAILWAITFVEWGRDSSCLSRRSSVPKMPNKNPKSPDFILTSLGFSPCSLRIFWIWSRVAQLTCPASHSHCSRTSMTTAQRSKDMVIGIFFVPGFPPPVFLFCKFLSQYFSGSAKIHFCCVVDKQRNMLWRCD